MLLKSIKCSIKVYLVNLIKANSFIGHYHFFLMDPNHHSYNVSGYEERVIHHGSFYGEWFFNFVFAATATTIISGSLAERVEFGSYLIYGVIATGFIQPVTGKFLNKLESVELRGFCGNPETIVIRAV